VLAMRGAGIALMAAVGGTLLSPASPLAGEPPVPPQALVATPATTVQAGKPIQLDSSKSTPGSTAIVDHLWDLDGNGSFETDTGAVPTAQLTPRNAGPLTVQLRVVDAQAQTSEAKLDLNVTQPQTTGTIEDVVSGSSSGQGQGSATTVAARATTAPALVPPKRLHAHRAKAHRKAATVRAAASAGVVIKNFQFKPGTSTVHVGDTITWTNQDIAPHTATAKDGSWDTGTIKKGKTGSHTFTTAGTIPYICSIHPNMKGTVVVLAASGSSGGTTPSGSGSGSSGSSSGSTPSASPSSSSSSSSSLPHTGLDIAVLVFIAMCLTGSGASLRRALR
jgi:plastocyanin